MAWSFYDVASSSYAAVVPTYFGIYFVSVVLAGAPGAAGIWGLTAGLALLVAGILAPLVGAWSDRRNGWLPCLVLSTAVCVVAMLLLPGVKGGHAVLVGGLFVAAQVGFTLATSIYDSLLVRVASRHAVARASGFGWAMGFCGGIVALACGLALLRGVPPSAQAARLPDVFGVAGVLFGLLAVPAIVLLRVHVFSRSAATQRTDRGGAWAGVTGTLRNWRRQSQVFRFLMAFFLMNDVLVTVMFFITIIVGTRFGFTIEGMLWLSLMYHAIAVPSTLAFGTAAARFGGRPTIYVQLTVIVACLFILAFGQGPVIAVVMVAMLGLVVGSLQAVCRSMLALMVDPRQAGEMFGFNTVAGRLSAAVGPLVFGAAVSFSGSEAVGLMGLVPFLALAAYLLAGVREPAHRPDAGPGPSDGEGVTS